MCESPATSSRKSMEPSQFKSKSWKTRLRTGKLLLIRPLITFLKCSKSICVPLFPANPTNSLLSCSSSCGVNEVLPKLSRSWRLICFMVALVMQAMAAARNFRRALNTLMCLSVSDIGSSRATPGRWIQGWLSTRAGSYLFLASTTRSLEMRSFASGDICRQTDPLKLYRPLMMLSILTFVSRELKGVQPDKRMYKMTPSDHMSAAFENDRFNKTSGEM
mmetsp:Transcript_8188/g.21067  ORF Transcript_8188/g.21067 Transcript_8188/m.21067 type:complete len:219 (-) Transcript_8188:626-1282(-)